MPGTHCLDGTAAGACAATTDQELEQSLEGVSAWLPEATHGDLVRRAAIRYAINGEPIVDQALARRGAGRLEEFVRTLARDHGDGLGSSGGRGGSDEGRGTGRPFDVEARPQLWRAADVGAHFVTPAGLDAAGAAFATLFLVPIFEAVGGQRLRTLHG